MSHTDPLVSVVIPSYRRAATIQTAANSALDQTMTDLEVIVVDDGSGDDTEQRVRDLADTRVKFFEHERNLGGNAARRTAIEQSRGRYIAFLDADDMWFASKLEKQLAALDRAGLTSGLVYTWYEIQRPDGTVVFDRRPTQEGLATPELLRANFVGTFSTVLVDRATLDKVGGPDPSLPACQDWEFYLRFNQEAPILCVPEVLVRYWEGSADPDRISSAHSRVSAGHRAVHRRYRHRIAALGAADAQASRRYLMEILANNADPVGVAQVAKDTSVRQWSPSSALFVAHMMARGVRKRYQKQ